MGSLTRISESPACAATTNVGRVVVAVPAGFDHGDVGRVDEDVAVAVVALELHQGWNIKRLRWDAGFQTQKAFANHLGVPPPQVHPVTGGFVLEPYNRAYTARWVEETAVEALHVIVYSPRREF